MAKKPSRSQQRQIAAIKSKNYSASYEKRLIRGVLSGKTRQQARGHVVKEHVVRKEGERERNAGLTNAEIKTIKGFAARINPKGSREPSEDDLIEWAQENGYHQFVEYRKTLEAAKRQYLKEQRNGSYSSRGTGYLDMLQEVSGAPDISWLYYH